MQREVKFLAYYIAKLEKIAMVEKGGFEVAHNFEVGFEDELDNKEGAILRG